MPTARTPDINLIEEDKLLSRPGGKIVSWVLGYGRVVLVMTEGVVIAALISRFWLYGTIADLTEKIDRKLAIVKDADSQAFEVKFRNLVSRINGADKIITDKGPRELFLLTKELIPEGIIISDLEAGESEISIIGKAVTEEALAVLVSNFKNNSSLSEVTVDKVNTQESTESNQDNTKNKEIAFSLKAKYKTSEGSKPTE